MANNKIPQTNKAFQLINTHFSVRSLPANDLLKRIINYPKLSLLTLMMLSQNLSVKGQEPAGVLKGSYTNYYKYYTPAPGSGMPAGSDIVSRGVVLLTDQENEDNDPERFAGSAFIINTFRNDDTLCVCTAGHVAKAVMNDGYEFLGSPPYTTYRFNMYMDYIGQENPLIPRLNQTLTAYKTPVPIGARVVKVVTNARGSGDQPDIALFLIDRRQLPAVANYATLGYELSTFYGKPIGSFYQIGYPFAMPQRITTNAKTLQNETSFENMLGVFPVNPPVGSGPGASGSPFVIQTLPDGRVSNTGTVAGVYCSGSTEPGTAIPEDAGVAIVYADELYGTELSVIANDIKTHCWKSKTETELMQSGAYKTSVIVNNSNNIQPFSQSQTLSQASDLTNIAAPNSYTVNTTYNTTPVTATYLKAAICKIGSLSFPTVSSANKPWQINIAAKEIIVTPSSTTTGFSYNATNGAELNLASVLVEPSSSSARLLSQDNPLLPDSSTTKSEGVYAIRPNPSTTGRFSVDLPTGANDADKIYEIQISALGSGKTIKKESVHVGGVYEIDLSAYAKGAYIITISRNGIMVYSSKLIYR